jgi:hypothetical protein
MHGTHVPSSAVDPSNIGSPGLEEALLKLYPASHEALVISRHSNPSADDVFRKVPAVHRLIQQRPLRMNMVVSEDELAQGVDVEDSI